MPPRPSYIVGNVISPAEPAMKLLFFILLILLIAQVGFWSTLGAVLGAVLMMVILFGLGIAALVVGILMLVAASVR